MSMRSSTAAAAAPPPLCESLLSHQLEALAWIGEQTADRRIGALLAHGMGMGKTVTALAHALCIHRHRQGTAVWRDDDNGRLSTQTPCAPKGPTSSPTIVIVACPKALVQQWLVEARRWGPILSTRIRLRRADHPSGTDAASVIYEGGEYPHTAAAVDTVWVDVVDLAAEWASLASRAEPCSVRGPADLISGRLADAVKEIHSRVMARIRMKAPAVSPASSSPLVVVVVGHRRFEMLSSGGDSLLCRIFMPHCLIVDEAHRVGYVHAATAGAGGGGGSRRRRLRDPPVKTPPGSAALGTKLYRAVRDAACWLANDAARRQSADGHHALVPLLLLTGCAIQNRISEYFALLRICVTPRDGASSGVQRCPNSLETVLDNETVFKNAIAMGMAAADQAIGRSGGAAQLPPAMRLALKEYDMALRDIVDAASIVVHRAPAGHLFSGIEPPGADGRRVERRGIAVVPPVPLGEVIVVVGMSGKQKALYRAILDRWSRDLRVTAACEEDADDTGGSLIVPALRTAAWLSQVASHPDALGSRGRRYLQERMVTTTPLPPPRRPTAVAEANDSDDAAATSDDSQSSRSDSDTTDESVIDDAAGVKLTVCACLLTELRRRHPDEGILVVAHSAPSLNVLARVLRRGPSGSAPWRQWGAPGHDSRRDHAGDHTDLVDTFALVTGTVSFATRLAAIAAFTGSHAASRQRSVHALLVTTRTGGLGLNLADGYDPSAPPFPSSSAAGVRLGASRVILLDSGWNPSHDAQAVHRVYRMGQCRAVAVYRLLAAGTLDETFMRLQRGKRELWSDVVAACRGREKNNATAMPLDSTECLPSRLLAALRACHHNAQQSPVVVDTGITESVPRPSCFCPCLAALLAKPELGILNVHDVLSVPHIGLLSYQSTPNSESSTIKCGGRNSPVSQVPPPWAHRAPTGHDDIDIVLLHTIRQTRRAVDVVPNARDVFYDSFDDDPTSVTTAAVITTLPPAAASSVHRPLVAPPTRVLPRRDDEGAVRASSSSLTVPQVVRRVLQRVREGDLRLPPLEKHDDATTCRDEGSVMILSNQRKTDVTRDDHRQLERNGRRRSRSGQATDGRCDVVPITGTPRSSAARFGPRGEDLDNGVAVATMASAVSYEDMLNMITNAF